MSNNGYFDLSTIFDIQKNHVVDLSNSYPHTDNASNIVSHVNELQNKLNSLSAQYDNANTASGAVLTEQRDMMDIVNTEHQRLLDKQAIIDEAQAEQERKALLNTTYRKKYAQYSKMTIVFCITLFGIILLTLASRYFTIFPQSLYSFLTACLIAIGIIYILVLYADLSVRDNINYDEIVIPPPKLDASGNLIGAGNATPSMWDALNKCKGSECCSPGTKWDADLRLCVSELGVKSQTPAAQTPAAQTPAAQTPAAQTPAAQTPAAQTPAAQTPAAQTPAAQTPAAQTPAAQTPAAQTPTATTPTSTSVMKSCDVLKTSLFKEYIETFNDENKLYTLMLPSYKTSNKTEEECKRDAIAMTNEYKNSGIAGFISKCNAASVNSLNATEEETYKKEICKILNNDIFKNYIKYFSDNLDGLITSECEGQKATSAQCDQAKDNVKSEISIIKKFTSKCNTDNFTTMHAAANYGEFYGKSILSGNITNNSKNYWMGSPSNVKPNMDKRFNDFVKI